MVMVIFPRADATSGAAGTKPYLILETKKRKNAVRIMRLRSSVDKTVPEIYFAITYILVACFNIREILKERERERERERENFGIAFC
jgi:hypothetical protein